MKQTLETVIVGAGQAGLSLSYELSRANREHVIIERGKVGQSWRNRWDSFCLVLPNWSIRLAGQAYQGAEPDGFMTRDVFVDYLDCYAQSFGAPVHEGISVDSLERGTDGQFLLRTSSGDISAHNVVLATGGFQKPYRPASVEQMSPFLKVIDSTEYLTPQSLPDGKVLLIGSGQTGCQIAEELNKSGRDVVIACGKAPWLPRRIGDRDCVAWLVEGNFMNVTLAELPSPMARLGANPQISGRSGGHDLNYRTLQSMGVVLAGHLVGAADGRAHFASDLNDSVAFGDARYNDIRELVKKSALSNGLSVPTMSDPEPFVANAPQTLELAGFGAAVVTAGYRPDFKSWVRIEGAFDDMGFPLQSDGVSKAEPGLYFMGVPFMRRRSSATLFGVGDDAEVVAELLVKGRQPA